MRTSSSDAPSLWKLLHHSGLLYTAQLVSANTNIALKDLSQKSTIGCILSELRAASVLVAAADQLTAALTLVELDGIVRRLVLCPPDLAPQDFNSVAASCDVDVIVSDRKLTVISHQGALRLVTGGSNLKCAEPDRDAICRTEWILVTSGTSGIPKMVVHTLPTLIGAIKRNAQDTSAMVWSTFYDIRRYGGLQVFLRALLGGCPLVLSAAEESTEEFLTRAGAKGITNISGTPSHWRRALMSPYVNKIAPRYVRLSGEIVDQAILDSLRAVYKEATIVHAFASTEAGVGFEVHDGLAGFPATLIGTQDSGVEMKVEDGSLRIRSPRTASYYQGSSSDALKDADGFVDTRDIVELRGDRYYFVGRRDGVINVGGLKVHPEEVEAVINRHPGVRMSLVKSRRSPVTGALVVADVVERLGCAREIDRAALKEQILESCRQALAPHKVPALIRFVPSIEMTPSGKLARV